MRIALVTPFAWGTPSAVNEHVALLSRELIARGHHPVVVTSSDDVAELQRMRLLMRRKQDLGLHLLRDWGEGAPLDSRLLPLQDGPLGPVDGVPVVPLGRSFLVRANGSVTNLGLPIDIMARLEHLLVHGSFDVVHVHEPLAPSLSFTAIRETRSPVVATFHLTPAGLRAYELGQSLLARFYERLDGRIVTSARAVSVLRESFPGAYAVVSVGTSLPLACAGRRAVEAEGASSAGGEAKSGGTVLYVYRGDDRRGVRAVLRAFDAGRPERMRRIIVAVRTDSGERWPPGPPPRSLGDLVEWREFSSDADLAALYASADVVVLPFLGGEWLMSTAVEALVSGVPAAGPDLPATREVLLQAAEARLFSPSREATLAQAVDALLAEAGAKTCSPAASTHTASEVADAVLGVYQKAAGLARPAAAQPRPDGRRPFGSPRPSPRQAVRLLGRNRPRSRENWIHADLHIHSNHSKDCRSPVRAILETARDVGLDAIAIADHNTISGALEARELAEDDLFVIVAEEVMTQQGEVIGLFLKELVPPGLTFDATLSLIKEQGALVYVPHPFDRLHTTPSYRCLVDNLHRIDAVETYNARVAFSGFNINAERFAAKYNLAAGAGSDAHVLPGLGTAMLRMPRFHGPEDFLEALREADIVARRKSLFYLQSLKLLQNTLDLVLPSG